MSNKNGSILREQLSVMGARVQTAPQSLGIRLQLGPVPSWLSPFSLLAIAIPWHPASYAVLPTWPFAAADVPSSITLCCRRDLSNIPTLSTFIHPIKPNVHIDLYVAARCLGQKELNLSTWSKNIMDL